MTLRGRFAEWLLPPRVGTAEYERREVRESEARWRAINAEKRAAGCRCGARATHVEYDHDNFGSVPVELWTCAKCVGASTWTRVDPDGQWVACWPRSQPCADCPGHCSTSWKTGADQPYEWHCPNKEA